MRGQSWVVARVEPASAPGSAEADQECAGVTLVHLQSVADGRFGDTLSVIWEVEPGRRVLPAGSEQLASRGGGDFGEAVEAVSSEQAEHAGLARQAA
ncbi:hypothetical protein [Streptomyces luteolus]|uniref:Uncharacterized protein n=1 Tax=Streptomyces luteolus TaxID=3043615 RepID=A0ABT6SYC7_9ACTN|nr:hypothetical protein [Streptomyces sp. B-S-A12]MDI3420615.1 hypothetical protein [Streptomyces sp. B-S-A12]